MNTINKGREDLEALLPWHAAGTLSRRDAERVEKALAADRELARRFDLVREELNETILLNEMLGAPSARAMEKLLAAIDAEPARKAKVSFDLAGRLASFVSSFSPRTLAYSASAAMLAIVLQAGVIATSLIKGGAGQGTVLASAGVTDASLAIIRFASKADVANITKFLEVNKASVIEGPKSGGIYTIRLPVTGKEKNDLIKRMQAQSDILEFIATVQ
jgi:anti-sigma factor RsiW